MNESQRGEDRLTGSKSDLITAAVKRAVRDAVVTHAKLGRAVPIARDGKVLWLSPEEILSEFEPESAP